METPTNPTLEVIDIAAVADIAHNAGAKLVVDNVFATPLYQSPLTLGADCVVYSATKHIDGQGRVLGGVILASEKFIMDHVHQVIRQTGPSLSPFNAWVLLKGLETLSVRVQRQTETAGAVSTALFGHKKISRLIYPGRADHPQADIIAKQMRAGSTLCSFEIKGGKEGAFRFLNGLQLIGITNNLGDAKSLITHPTTTTHQRLTPEQRAELGIGDGLVRFSAGLEHPDDMIEDLLTALDKVLRAKPGAAAAQRKPARANLRHQMRHRGRRHDRPLRGLGDGQPEALGHAGIAPVVHVQPVGRHERLERHVIDLAPALHHVEAAEQIDVFLLRGRGDQLDHVLGFRLRDHLRRELRIDQHDVGAGGADLVEAVADRGAVVGELVIADDRIGAELPQHQVGLGGDHG